MRGIGMGRGQSRGPAGAAHHVGMVVMVHGRGSAVRRMGVMSVKLGRIKSGVVKSVQGRTMYIGRIHGVLLLHEWVLLLLLRVLLMMVMVMMILMLR